MQDLLEQHALKKKLQKHCLGFPYPTVEDFKSNTIIIAVLLLSELPCSKGDQMGLLDKIFGKGENVDVPDLEEVMEAEGDVVSPPAEFYVKRIDLRNEGDGDLVVKELMQKNIIILNVLPLSKQPNRLKGIIAKLKSHAGKINGDIALLSTDSIILTPSNVKIVKSKPKPKKAL